MDSLSCIKPTRLQSLRHMACSTRSTKSCDDVNQSTARTSTSPTLEPSEAPLVSPVSSVMSTDDAQLVQPYYNPDLFLLPAPDHLLCAICLGVVHNPLNLACSHLFCASCITHYCHTQAASRIVPSASSASDDLSISDASHTSLISPESLTTLQPITHACPTCRAPFSLFLASCNFAIQQITSNMEMHCPNVARGCQATMSMGLKERNVIAHRKICPFEMVSCRYAPDCSARKTRADLEAHETTRCSERLTRCDHCFELIRFNQWDTHHSSPLGCTNMVQCPNDCDSSISIPADDFAESKEQISDSSSSTKKRKLSSDEHDTCMTGDQTSESTPDCGASMCSTTSSASTKRKLATTTVHSKHATILPRSSLTTHLNVCSLQVISCDLCSAHIRRRDMPEHLASSLITHFMALQRHLAAERANSASLRSEVIHARAEASEARQAASDVARQLSAGPLFAYFFDISPISLLCSHYVSNDFICGDHVFYFALHRQLQSFSAYLYVKSGSTPVPLSFVLMVKSRNKVGNSLRSTGDLSTSSHMSRASASMSSVSSVPDEQSCALQLKLDVRYDAFEGKGIRNWFTLSELQERGGYSEEEDTITIGILIKDHSSSWVYHSSSQLALSH